VLPFLYSLLHRKIFLFTADEKISNYFIIRLENVTHPSTGMSFLQGMGGDLSLFMRVTEYKQQTMP
jgi:hypothetical protein